MYHMMEILSSELVLQYLPSSYQKIYIGYSGGIDSHVLLHLCALEKQLKNKITAVYIHHGLQAVADEWHLHCQSICQQLNLPYLMLKVDAKAKRGESPEEAARNARYLALQNLLAKDDILLFAQHRSDQMETLLIQLFRGSGVQGLASMPQLTKLGQGVLIRPLLTVAKQAINAYAQCHQLNWINDPSNQNNDFDRNYLRNEIIPLLNQRWPALDKSIARSAKHCANACAMIDEWIQITLPTICDSKQKSILIEQLNLYNDNQQNHLIRAWLQIFGLKPPSEVLLASIKTQVINIKIDANPQLYYQGFYICKYQAQLYCLPSQFLQPLADKTLWPESETTFALKNGYQLIRCESAEGIKKEIWHCHTVSVEKRRGGEKIILPGRKGQHSLKNLYQEASIPTWERTMRPLIYFNGVLTAVAGLWIADWAYTKQANDCYQIEWQPQLNI